ncbi:LuxR family transcriptional regulator [Mesorhizobium sp. M4B.F.Ca.ET.169.01.1.1]|uniref:helix-turn-helix transcriptional regulator n=1 Tax=unclassified Mesorhizobium TaxID=325217 RepID=UPI000FC9DD95|nr:MULTISPECIES: LuxR family transcriptional regulator [unclassified Mesorhizobium]RVD46089.1 LuxR family transcriptional regulator [Mesorhizobium sp. M4B.F.Ca.ET.019.03.1.1]TGT41911.1 LuxR family transcriptional regulator [Mesorhizobium sp. M4B.F.Ca.ET.169.01.1.1]
MRGKAYCWRRQLEETGRYISDIQESRTVRDVCDCLLAFARCFGATNLLAGVIPPPSASRREQLSHVILDAWPEEWSNRYFSSGYLYRDPTIRLVRQCCLPFAWNEVGALCNVTGVGRRIMNEATEFDLSEGFTVAFATIERLPVGVSIAGKRLEADPTQRMAFQLVAACALGCASALVRGERPQKLIKLSPRQLDVLHWAAEGLTVDQIAGRLTISSNTADTHLRIVRNRLGVTSTIHAVAEAFRLGLIT